LTHKAPSVPQVERVHFVNGVLLQGKFRDLPTNASHASQATGDGNRKNPSLPPLTISFFLIPLGMAVFLTMIGAFGTDRFGLIKAFIYWSISLMGGSVIASSIQLALRKWPIDNPYLELSVFFLGVAAIVLFYVWWLNSHFFEQPLNLKSLQRLIIPVLVISGAMTIVNFLAAKDPMQTHEILNHNPSSEVEIGTATQTIRPVFYEHLDSRYQEAEILAVQSEDHYLKVFTSQGDTLILMRLRDAVLALNGIEGSQVHRSWWISKSAITKTLRTDGKAVFHLKNGICVPVSRSYLKALKDTGWI
jgi:hypothetical protein